MLHYIRALPLCSIERKCKEMFEEHEKEKLESNATGMPYIMYVTSLVRMLWAKTLTFLLAAQ